VVDISQIEVTGPYVKDFLSRVVGIDAFVTFETQLSHIHPFDGFETLGELFGSDGVLPLSREFVSYSVWSKGIREETKRVYGVTFREYDPYLWRVGNIIRTGKDLYG